jgi:hypothetical protein
MTLSIIIISMNAFSILKLGVAYSECNLFCVTYKPSMLSVIMLNVVMRGVVVLIVMAPTKID